ncbi:M1 family metallopeptidase [Pasteuria penetrans]|uniref:M1 family metallopeptidase n=1 Tax=Pasteuria penetrans TaxID=86005 RepID=UPI000FB8E58C|nr:M1 family metallopeptidase [Pasteuria penetrans]
MMGKLIRWLPQWGTKTLQICLGFVVGIGIGGGIEYNPYLGNHTYAQGVYGGGELTPCETGPVPVYEIAGTYEPEQRDLKGHMQLHVPANLLEAQGDSVFLRLYPNVFYHWKYENSLRPATPGFLTPHNVKINGQNAAIKLYQDGTILQVHLPQQIRGTTLNIEMDYHLRIPERGVRLSQDGKTAILSEWYPMLAVRDQNGWHLDPYKPESEFYTRAADYHVSLKVPSGYRVISTGRNPEPSENAARISSYRTRDFIAVITSEYQALTSQEDGVRVHLWYQPKYRELAQSLQHTVVSSLCFFSEKFGAYRDEITDELDIVLDSSRTNPGNAGGIEHPGLSTVHTRVKPEGPLSDVKTVLSTNAAHEVAHQWWYGFVGNDQIREAWLDEGLTRFSEALYMKNVEGKENTLDFIRQMVSLADEKGAGKEEAPTGDPSFDKLTKEIMEYDRPAMMMFDLATAVGGMDELLGILKKYHIQYRHKIATGCDFIRFVEYKSGKDLKYIFKKWLYRLPKGCSLENEKQ